MPRSRKSYLVFGKVHISPWVDFKENLIVFLKTDKRIISKRGAYEYGFGDIEFVLSDLVFGRLGKVHTKRNLVVDDKESRQFTRKDIGFGITEEYSNFLIDIKNKQIVFEDRRGRLPEKKFREVVSELYKRVHTDLSDLQISMKSETEEVLEEIRSYELIKRIKFQVTPSNPEDMPEFKELDKILKDSRTEHSNMSFENKKEGLKVEKTILEQGIHLCSSGYGEFDLDAMQEGQPKKFSSSDKVVCMWESFIDVSDEIISLFLKKMREVFESKNE